VEKYPERFLHLMKELGRYPLVYEDQNQEKVVEAGLSSVTAKPLQVRVEAPDAKQLKAWAPPKSLKQQVLQDERPQAELYKRLIKAWPDISDAKLREILEEVPRERIEKALYVYDFSGRLFDEFLEPNLTHEQIILLDRVHRYYHLLSEAKELRILEDLKGGFHYDVSIDGKKYKAELFAFLDQKRASLNFYPDSFDRPKLGIPYTDWPCLQKFKEAVRRRAENLAASLMELRVNRNELLSLQNEIEHLRELENSFLPLGIENFITFPTKYAVKDGVFGGNLYVNKIILPCGLCGKRHALWLIAKVR